MKIIGPERFELNIKNPGKYTLLPWGNILYSDKKKIPKLYIISHDNVPIYVGITVQPIRNRLNYGFSAVGVGGYHGYAWRKKSKKVDMKKVDMFVWFLKNSTAKNDIETVEAEVVYEIRKHGQWPKYQTEIHFHHSSAEHRKWAKKILKVFKFK